MITVDTTDFRKQVDSLVARMKAFPQKLQGPLADALLKSATMVAGDAKRNVVANRSVVSGRLLTSITQFYRAEEVAAYAGPGNVPYARFVEFGFEGKKHVAGYTRNGGTVFGRRHNLSIFVRPHDRYVSFAGKPYLFPAYNALRPRILAEIRKAVRDQLNRDFGGSR